MPIASIFPFQKSSTTRGIADQAKELIETIQARFDQRNAIRYKVPAGLGHKFEQTILTAPTYCALCTDLIWGCLGQRCETCKLSSHRKCLERINTRCAAQTFDKHTLGHSLKRTTFWTPSYCDHCGTLIKGIYEQGLKCGCGLELHYDCERLISWTCKNQQVSSKQEESHQRQHNICWSRICIEDFDLVSFLGSGSYSNIYLARLKSSQKEYAIKVINKSTPVVGGDPKSVFSERDILTLGRDSSFFPTLHCCFQSEKRLYYVMDYVAGRDLLYHIRKARRFTESRARYYGAEIFLALDFLHSRKVIYRDLKLENVILDKYGHCKLLDFGMSKDLNITRCQKARTFCGTPSYISPEMIREQDYDYSIDWWSFGVLMFEMMIGYSPFESDNEDGLYKSIVDDTVTIPNFLTIEAKSLLEGLLIKDPNERLGCQILEDRTKEILEHPFFRNHWNEADDPPYIPSRIDLDLTVDSHDNSADLYGETKGHSPGLAIQEDFEGFEYYSESFADDISLK